MSHLVVASHWWLGFAIVFHMIGASVQDLRTRTISNWWNGLWGFAFLGVHVWLFHTFLFSLYGMVVMGMATFVPTWKGYFGVGDWKMAMVLGAAAGFGVAGMGWILAMVIQLRSPMIRFTVSLSSRKLPMEKIHTMPFAVPLCVSTILMLIIKSLV